MIEVIYNETSKEAKENAPIVRLPKNVRQIGTAGNGNRIYVEDYVITYLNQFSGKDISVPKVAVLMGQAVSAEENYIFISGAIDVEEIEIDSEGITFTEQVWGSIYEKIKEYFDQLEIVGWFLSVPGFPVNINETIVKTHLDNFAGNQKVFMMSEPIEKEDAFYSYEQGELVKQPGYYIYYEKNNAMQSYMISRHEEEGEESAEVVEDYAARHFRTIVQEKREYSQQKRITAFMYSISSFLVMVVLIIGITMMNNYDKMKNMEAALQNISKNVIGGEKESLSVSNSVSNNEVIPVEPLEGNVEPVPEEMKGEELEAAAAAENGQVSDGAASGQDLQENGQTEITDAGQQETPSEPVSEDTLQITEPETPQVSEDPKNKPEEPLEEPSQETKTEPINYYTVKKGDTLAIISKKVYNTTDKVDEICAKNNIEDINKIFVGQKIILP